MSAPALRLVDTDTGRLYEGPGDIAAALAQITMLEDQLKGAERDLNGWRHRYRELERDKMAEGAQSRWWPVALALFDRWRVLCRHPRSGWTLDRWLAIKPFLEHKRYGPQICEQAIAGKAFDPFTRRLLNGRVQRYDLWHNIFGTADKLEAAANAAPLDWAPVVTSDEQLALYFAEAEAQ